MPDRRKSYCMYRAHGHAVVNVLVVGRSGRNEDSFPLRNDDKAYSDIVNQYVPGSSGVRADVFDWGCRNEGSQALAYAILEYHLQGRTTVSMDKDSYEYSLVDRFGAHFLWFEECKPEHGLIITTEDIDKWFEKVQAEDVAARDNLNESERRGADHVE